MPNATYKILWTDEAKADLKDIYDFIKLKSIEGAKNVVADIKNAPKSIHFPSQNQDELYNKKYLRIIVRHYKILYKINEQRKELIVYVVFDTNQSPDKLKVK